MVISSALVSENTNFILYEPCVICLTLLLSRLLQSGSEPGLSLSHPPEHPFSSSLVCQDMREPNKLVVVKSNIIYTQLWSPR